ncbi:Fic family protein [Chitinophaga sancti]|uniref:Fic family protein n=1 Tax=Chitinophaga sancti TaxID=1004 RepID=UPI002A75E0C3|nr:Fic family protein [Chitinophaga sancti]WPQ60675.1 Fic family protein [Chitinophaga sancti]
MSYIYLYQLKDWPHFQWDKEAITEILADVRFRQGRLLGSMESLGFNLQDEATLETLTLDVIKSSEIEGEILNHDQVRSSIARRLGIEVAGLIPADRNVEGIVEMMLDATQRHAKPLTTDRLFGWQASMFPTGFSGMYKIVVGTWRNNAKDDPMQVVSGGMGREKVHFQAPDADKLDAEMNQFINWFNSENTIDPIIKAAIAHLWFVTIHPFDDGNGRIARAITDMQLARADETSRRFYSMSAQIRTERSAYYDILERTQKGSTDITEWIIWFITCLSRALNATEHTLSTVIKKAKFWNHPVTKDLNDRQKLMLNKLLDGFDGKFTSSKWGKIAKCSHDTAIRDIQNLIDRNILLNDGSGGRSTGYLLNENFYEEK